MFNISSYLLKTTPLEKMIHSPGTRMKMSPTPPVCVYTQSDLVKTQFSSWVWPFHCCTNYTTNSHLPAQLRTILKVSYFLKLRDDVICEYHYPVIKIITICYVFTQIYICYKHFEGLFIFFVNTCLQFRAMIELLNMIFSFEIVI